jgi:hypothetical protein
MLKTLSNITRPDGRARATRVRRGRVSPTPYMPIVKRAAAATNQTTPVAVALMSMPLAIAATISTATCRAVIANATARLPSTSSERGRRRALLVRPNRPSLTPSPRNGET